MSDLPILQPVGILLRGLAPPYPGGLPVKAHLDAVIDWIETAYRAAGDGGISKGYDLLRRRWAPSYPETTGYSIPTLLNASMRLARPELATLALSLADYLMESATPEGGVVHWQLQAQPVVFDTGQVMFGWLAAFSASQDQRYLQAAARAGDWLVSILDASGSWKKNQHLGVEKVIDTRVAWALLELHRHTQNETHRLAAIRNLDWALQQQDPDGWFNRCAFTYEEDPFTHTLAYTAEGLFECGRILGEQKYIRAARLTADSMLALQHLDGRLASTFGKGWKPTSRSSCLTGDCQMGILWLQLCEMTGEPGYAEAAQKTIAFVARTQALGGSSPNVRGAIMGSYPLTGRYERLKAPNWAAKFFVDALLKLDETDATKSMSIYVG